jgi:hypothetical protein
MGVEPEGALNIIKNDNKGSHHEQGKHFIFYVLRNPRYYIGNNRKDEKESYKCQKKDVLIFIAGPYTKGITGRSNQEHKREQG